MRQLDAHVHIFDAEVADAMREVAARDGVTHYAAVLEDLELLDAVSPGEVTAVPFLWVHQLDQLPEDAPVGGYKVHPREPLGAPDRFAAGEATLGQLCERAGPLGRPVLLHSDCDRPRTCDLAAIARLARNHPEATLIAAHAGVFAGPYFEQSEGLEYTPAEWRRVAKDELKQNLPLLLDVPNLYADTVIFGVDDPARGEDRDLRFRLFREAVGRLSEAARRALAGKLFIGTDFPCFYEPEDRACQYGHQVECMRELFGDAFDPDESTAAFLGLLPPAIRS